MNKAILSKRITSILSDITRLTNTLYALQMTDIQSSSENYSALSSDAAHRGELIACRLRHLYYAANLVDRTEYLTSAAEEMGIGVQMRDGIIEITIPGLMPHRKRWQNTEFLMEPLSAVLSRFVSECGIPRMGHCTGCFVLRYDKELPDRRVCDYDNFELKRVLDAAAAYFLPDDSGLHYDAYYTTELGEGDCTMLYLMGSDRFPEWLAERQLRSSLEEQF